VVAFLPSLGSFAQFAGMSTLTKPRAKKSARAVRKVAARVTKSVTLRAVDENGRLIPGYAAAYAFVRPGVDLTKPTLSPGKYFQ
jgi:hypothetical protein